MDIQLGNPESELNHESSTRFMPAKTIPSLAFWSRNCFDGRTNIAKRLTVRDLFASILRSAVGYPHL